MLTLFISDLHLEEKRPDITEALLRFLRERAPQADALYILGDFFEAWIGDDEHTPLQETIAQALRAVSDRGVKLFLMHGNRDFLIGEDFCERIGAELLPDPTVIDLHGRPTLLMHGDSLCTADVEYQKFRANMRNPQWQEVFLKRPLADRQQVARQLREISMAKNKGKQEFIMDVTQEEVERVMDDANVQWLIHGHTHRPAVHTVSLENGEGTRMVLGDWDGSVWWIEARDQEVPELLEEPFQTDEKQGS